MRHFTFALFDAVASIIAIEGAAFIVRATLYPNGKYGFISTTVSCVAALLMGVFSSYLLALHSTPDFLSPRRVLARTALVGLVVGLSTLVISHYVFFEGIGRIALTITGLLVWALFASWRIAYGRVLSHGERIPVLMLGDLELGWGRLSPRALERELSRALAARG